jgi:Ca2+/Na+ antiporter
MVYLAMFHWAWLTAALLLGLGMGWIAVVHRGRSLSDVMLRRIAIVLAVAACVALAQLFPGRAGYWSDLGGVMLVLYLAGCAAGSWLRDRLMVRHALVK